MESIAENKEIEISYKKVFLYNKNPRFFRMNLVDWKINELGYNLDYEIGQILSDEENFLKYHDLIESLVNRGYQKHLNTIFVIRSNTEKYYTIEGNRRLSAIYILNNKDKYLKILEKYTSLNKGYGKKIIDLIGKYENKTSKIECIKVFDVTGMSNKEIKEIVKSRHTAEQRGKKNWSRAKDLVDLADAYEEIIKNNTKEETISLLADENNRSINAITSDLENSFFVRRLIELNNLNLDKTNKNFVEIIRFESSPII